MGTALHQGLNKRDPAYVVRRSALTYPDVCGHNEQLSHRPFVNSIPNATIKGRRRSERHFDENLRRTGCARSLIALDAVLVTLPILQGRNRGIFAFGAHAELCHGYVAVLRLASGCFD